MVLRFQRFEIQVDHKMATTEVSQQLPLLKYNWHISLLLNPLVVFQFFGFENLGEREDNEHRLWQNHRLRLPLIQLTYSPETLK